MASGLSCLLAKHSNGTSAFIAKCMKPRWLIIPESATAVEITAHQRDVVMAWFEFVAFNVLD